MEAQVKEKPILFSGEMVRAIREGRKVQTRRVVKNNRTEFANVHRCRRVELQVHDEHLGANFTYEKYTGHDDYVVCPFGRPGDRLWVRERARIIETSDGMAAGNLSDWKYARRVRVRYEADGAESDWLPYPSRLAYLEIGHCVPNGCYREAARLTLELTDVRVERLQEISDADAFSEGLQQFVDENRGHTGDGSARGAFKALWDSINGKREGCTWADDPWVWVLSFRPARGEERLG